ncbi:MAG TPA: sulfatase-like hydrolase/transferase, partial [Pseudomonadales bacterium]|nr:sulfatase-like hydrolase/transferase [Pseudomonadales bacterium]
FWFASKDAHDPYYWNPPLLRQDPSAVVVPSYAKNDAFTRQVMAGYYDEIARADDNIGRVVNVLREKKLLDNTLIIVLSDNGSQIGGAKTTLYDEGLKTPLVMRLPAIMPAGVVNQQLVSAVDLMPTILQLAGLSPVQGAPGISLFPTLKNPAQSVRSYIYAERNRHGSKNFERLLRSESFFYKRNIFSRRLCDPYWDTVFDPDRPRDSAYEEFYDLQRDHAERNNRVSEREYRDNVNNARQMLSAIMAESEQNSPALILQQCPPRVWSETIRWPWRGHE